MNRVKSILAIIALATVGLQSAALAQTPNPRRPHARPAATNPQALAALQTDLTSAINSMTGALPIYDGFRVKSIHAAHRALVIVDRAIAGTQAMVRPKPTVRDHVPSNRAHAKYTQQQIAASQTAMQQGLAALTQAQADLNAAASGGKKAMAVSQDLQRAVADANTALNIHSGGATTNTARPGVIRPGLSRP